MGVKYSDLLLFLVVVDVVILGTLILSYNDLWLTRILALMSQMRPGRYPPSYNLFVLLGVHVDHLNIIFIIGPFDTLLGHHI